MEDLFDYTEPTEPYEPEPPFRTTLDVLLQSQPSLATLRTYALVLTPELHATLVAVQESLGPRQHQAQAVPLTDGRYMLGADLLSEINTGGLYAAGFGQLPPEALPLVDVMPMAEALALRPEPVEGLV